VQDQMALGYIPMPEGSRAPAPTKAATKAAAKYAGDYAGELADKAVDKIGPAADKIAAATRAAIDKATEAFSKATAGMKKDDGVEDAEVVSEATFGFALEAVEPSGFQVQPCVTVASDPRTLPLREIDALLAPSPAAGAEMAVTHGLVPSAVGAFTAARRPLAYEISHRALPERCANGLGVASVTRVILPPE